MISIKEIKSEPYLHLSYVIIKDLDKIQNKIKKYKGRSFTSHSIPDPKMEILNDPKKALKIIKEIKFAFEYQLYQNDDNWERIQKIKSEFIKKGLWELSNAEKKEYYYIVQEIDEEYEKRQRKGLKLFAKYYPYFFVIGGV